jgi:L,D-transpeptidase catalytic domain
MRKGRGFISILVAAMLLTAPLAALPLVAHADGDSCIAANTPGCTSGLPTFQYQMLLSQMAAHPTPDVRRVDVDEHELGTNAFDRVIGGTQPLYDAPNGNQVGVINPGFNFVQTIKEQDDWTEVLPGRWLPDTNLSSADSSVFSGVVIDQPLAYMIGWVLEPTRPSDLPGGDPDPEATMTDRYTLVNVFATVVVDDFNWYLIGPGEWMPEQKVAVAHPTQRPDGVKGRWVSVDLYEQVLTAYQDDTMVYATLVSTGLPRPNWGTNKGLFRIWARLASDRMTSAEGGPDGYDLPNVPWVEYFDHSIALHGAYWHDGFGYRHSHGCVNMSVTDAQWMYDWTDGFYSDAWVYVYTTKDGVKPE